VVVTLAKVRAEAHAEHGCIETRRVPAVGGFGGADMTRELTPAQYGLRWLARLIAAQPLAPGWTRSAHPGCSRTPCTASELDTWALSCGGA
jgi:hypothetical protein